MNVFVLQREMNHQRYRRQLALPGFNQESQTALASARVLIVGCGGLGNPVIMYLAGAGIGHLGLVDDDVIQIDNLHRQIIFNESDIGKKKLEVARDKVRAMNGEVDVQLFDLRLDVQHARDIIREYDIVVDCTDNFETRHLLDDICASLQTPLVYGALYRYEGQVAVFNFEREIRYCDLVPETPPSGIIPDCEIGGVLGPMAGTIATMQAGEVIKIITGIGEVLDGKIAIIDFRDYSIRQFTVQKRTVVQTKHEHTMKEISKQEFENLKSSGEEYQLIDVREPYEYEMFNLGGELIPMETIPNNLDKISRTKKVVVHCKAGMRSAHVIRYLMSEHGFNNLYNLKDGIMPWQ